MKEIGRAALTIPVFTSNVVYNEVEATMETVSADNVRDWLKKNIVESLRAKRKKSI